MELRVTYDHARDNSDMNDRSIRQQLLVVFFRSSIPISSLLNFREYKHLFQ